MKQKQSVLIVSNNQKEIEVIRSIFRRVDPGITVVIAGSARECLDLLMGGVLIQKSSAPLKPHLVLMDEHLVDMNARSLLEIIKKYYTLSHIKIYLITGSENARYINTYSALVDGYFSKPVMDDEETAEQFSGLIDHLRHDRTNQIPLATLPGMAGLLKKQLAVIKTGSSLFKAAACVAGAIGVSAVVIGTSIDKDSPGAMVRGPAVEAILPDTVPAGSAAIILLDTMVIESNSEPEVRPVFADEATVPSPDTVITTAEEIKIQDTIQPKRIYSIGVRSEGSTR